MVFYKAFYIASFCTVTIAIVNGMAIKRSSNSNDRSLTTDDVVNFLVTFGYLAEKRLTQISNSSRHNNVTSSNATKQARHIFIAKPERLNNNPYTSNEISEAITDFQAFTNLKQTGTITSETSKAMLSERCGVKDKDPRVSVMSNNVPGLNSFSNRKRRKRRFVVEGSKWPKMTVTYCITQPSAQLTINEQKVIMEAAFRRWAEICPLVFRWTDNHQTADVNIRFASGSHGDGKPFDGNGGVLAHGFFPTSGGDIHFDEDEIWHPHLEELPTDTRKQSLLKVAIHEIGHSIGLEHTSVVNAAMNAYWSSTRSFEFSADDVYGAQSLYGQCETPVDTVFSWMGNRRTYFMKGGDSWRFDDIRSETERGYPKPIKDQWIGVPDDVDEAFLWSQNWVTYFFKGSLYYRYNDQMDRVESGYPKPINSGWPGIPDNIDAAFTISVDISYFLKGNLCYKFDNNNDEVFAGYPKKINECFPGIPDNIDTAVRYIWDNVVYFFKGLVYYKYDRFTKAVVGPLLIKNKWRNLCSV